MGYERTLNLSGRYHYNYVPDVVEEVRELTAAEIKAQQFASQFAKMPLLKKLLSKVS